MNLMGFEKKVEKSGKGLLDALCSSGNNVSSNLKLKTDVDNTDKK